MDHPVKVDRELLLKHAEELLSLSERFEKSVRTKIWNRAQQEAFAQFSALENEIAAQLPRSRPAKMPMPAQAIQQVTEQRSQSRLERARAVSHQTELFNRIRSGYFRKSTGIFSQIIKAKPEST